MTADHASGPAAALSFSGERPADPDSKRRPVKISQSRAGIP